MPEAIAIKDVGPNENLLINLPPGGGVVVLKAINDLGKSEALDAVDYMLTGNGRIDKRFGSERGEMSYGSARVTITKQPRRSGKIGVETIEDPLGIHILVNPGIADPEKADSARIKALLRISDLKPELKDFYPVLGDQEAFEKVVSPASRAKLDVVELAAAIKRDIEAASRVAANEAERFAGIAEGHRQAAIGYDPNIETDQGELDREHAEAVKVLNGLVKQYDDAKQCAEANTTAKRLLERTTAAYTGPTLEEAAKTNDEAIAVKEKAADALETAKRNYSEAVALAEQTRVAHLRAKEYSDLCAEWRQTLEAPAIASPTGAELAAAQDAVVVARAAIDAGALARDKKNRLRSVEVNEAYAGENRKEAERFRAAARGMDDLLSGLVARCGSCLLVEEGRLVVHDERDGETRTVPFSELSDGRRTTIAVDIAIESLRRKGKEALMTLPQRFWSELDVFNRTLVHEHAKAAKCHILTAEATQDADDDGTMKVEPFESPLTQAV